MSIAENIKRLREAHGITQAELGEIAGVSDKAVSSWEAGIKFPRMGAVQKIADHFGIKKSAIVDDNIKPTPVRGITITDKDELLMLTAYRAADPVFRAAAVDILLAHPADAADEKKA